jgi:hypothetical protein
MTGGAASKRKGSAFERELCRDLSLWVSRAEHEDLFWRSAISGGRATNRVAKHGAQKVSGDICSVREEGHIFTNWWHIEAKHVRDMNLTSFALNDTGFLATEWRRCVRQATSHRKLPMLIVKQNRYPVIVVLQGGVLDSPYLPLLSLPRSNCVINLFGNVIGRPYTIPRMPF